VGNPFNNTQLKEWPDFLLAFSGVSFVVSLMAMFSGSSIGLPCALIFGGLVLFGVGGKVAHYRFRDSGIKGNGNAWFSGWRHSLLADSFAGIGVVLVLLAAFLIYLRTDGT